MPNQRIERAPGCTGRLYLRVVGCAVLASLALALGAVAFAGAVVGTWTATVTFPSAGATLNTHGVKPAGTAADSNGGTVPAGTTVTATITLGSQPVGSCTASTNAIHTWQCGASIIVPADGSYTVTATVRQADNSEGPPSDPVTFATNTKPTLTQPSGGVTNNNKPVLGGAKIGDGTSIRVCGSSTPCSSGASACNRSGLAPSATTWTCTPTNAIPTNTYYAFEIDANGGFSAASNGFALTINSAAATASEVQNGGTVRVRSLPLSGTCASGETVAAAFTFSNGSPWPSSGAQQAKVTTICSGNAWSGNVLLPYNTNVSNLRLVVSQVAPDNSAAPTNTITGIAVQIQPFHINTILWNGNNIAVGFDGWVGDTYRIERKLSMADSTWQPVPNVNDVTPTANDPVEISDPDSPNEMQAFYHVILVP